MKGGKDMKKTKFNKLIKEHNENLQELINKHINGDLYFTQNELDIIIRKRGERIYKRKKGVI
jgi:hypothetical protein